MRILAIDQGNAESGYLLFDTYNEIIEFKGKIENNELISFIPDFVKKSDIHLAIEEFKSYGMPIGQTTIDAIEWGGRFLQKFIDCGGLYYEKIPRKDVCKNICNNGKAKDAHIRQALIDRYEPELTGKQRPKNKLKGVSKDIWSALAIAVTYFDTNIKNSKIFN